MIKYMPKLDSQLWAFKCIEYFDTPEDLKAAIADNRTRFYRAIGKPYKEYKPNEVHLISQGKDLILGWRNYCSVVLDGKTVGFCGE